ncbi:TPR end-of-group domain-containing protein [Leptospira kmetyi]|uniref:TPR end-of-group domain-containing protein n=1 Tax=Leptospira kmetyi TaxID=408139 RepID=UPI00108451F0|nr:hypothetical protein [Leptospira kmetyi]TGK13635.1 hypothetical protein EHO62_18040 [Leptospira kmetyi]TGK29120.1 hypothetical protein EHO66_10035 [Leptospira kmetyi]
MSPFTAEELKSRFQLPEDAIKGLLTKTFFDSKIAGRLRLGGESLCPIQLTFLNETKDREKLRKEPKQKHRGRYVCEALSLADCDYNDEGIFDGQIFVWIPSLRSFASWDAEHEQSFLFPGIGWAEISKDPVRYLCSQWQPIEEGKNIWDLFELWNEFPYVIYANEFFGERLPHIKKNFESARYGEVVRLSAETLRDAERPLLDSYSVICGKIECLSYKSVSGFLLNEVESFLVDFEALISIAKQGDTQEQVSANHPNWYLEHARQIFSVVSSSSKEGNFELLKVLISGLIRRNNEESFHWIESFCTSYPSRLKDLLKILHSSLELENKGNEEGEGDNKGNGNTGANRYNAGEEDHNFNSQVRSKIVSIEERLEALVGFQHTIERMKTAIASDDFHRFHLEFQKIRKAGYALDTYKSNILAVMNDALLALLKKREIESGRALIHVYSERLDLLKPSWGYLDRKAYEELFANALCLIHSDDEINREFLKLLEKKFLPIVRENGAVRILAERLARNLACIYTTMHNFESAYFFLKLAMERGAKKEDLLNETDFDPLRREERFVALFKKYYQESPNRG